MTKKTAFTLAEVLITLGIIAVVAAMTLPTLIQKYQNSANVARLEKFYSILSQVAISAQEEYGSFDTWQIIDSNQNSTRQSFSRIEPYFKIIRKCDNVKGCWAEKTLSLSGEKARWSDSFKLGNHCISISLNDGVNVSYDHVGPSYNAIFGFPNYLNKDFIILYVDVNGDKKPNTFGRDIFLFALGKNGVIPAGIANNSANCSPKKRGFLSGVDCAYKVLQEKAIKY